MINLKALHLSCLPLAILTITACSEQQTETRYGRHFSHGTTWTSVSTIEEGRETTNTETYDDGDIYKTEYTYGPNGRDVEWIRRKKDDTLDLYQDIARGIETYDDRGKKTSFKTFSATRDGEWRYTIHLDTEYSALEGDSVISTEYAIQHYAEDDTSRTANHKTIIHYDDRGLRTYSTTYKYVQDNLILWSRTRYTYDTEGHEIKTEVFKPKDGDWEPSSISGTAYDSRGRITADSVYYFDKGKTLFRNEYEYK